MQRSSHQLHSQSAQSRVLLTRPTWEGFSCLRCFATKRCFLRSFPSHLEYRRAYREKPHLSLLAKNDVFFTRLDPTHTWGAVGALTLQDHVNQPFLPQEQAMWASPRG